MSLIVSGQVWTHSTAKGGDLVVLLAIADNADEETYEAFPGIEYLADKTNLSTRGVRYAIKRLVEAGELEILERGGFRQGESRANLYRVNCGTNRQSLQGVRTGKMQQTNRNPASPQPSVEPKGVCSGKAAVHAFEDLTAKLALSGDIEADAVGLLSARHKADRKIVTAKEMAVAAAVIAAFRDEIGVAWSLGPHLKSVVLRAREVPSWTPETHVDLVRAACEDPWWERTREKRRPTGPNVVYSPAAFVRAVQAAADNKKGRKRELDRFDKYDAHIARQAAAREEKGK